MTFVFYLGLLLKDSLFGGMKDTFTTMMYSNYDSEIYGMSGYSEAPPSVNYVSPSSYYGDPTRVFDSSEGEEIIGSYSLFFQRFRNKIESSATRFRNDQNHYVHD